MDIGLVYGGGGGEGGSHVRSQIQDMKYITPKKLASVQSTMLPVILLYWETW